MAYDSNLEAEIDAKKAAVEAAYRQSGIEDQVNRLVENRVPSEYKPLIAKTTMIARVLLEQKVELKWSY